MTLDLRNQRFGRLIAIEPTEKRCGGHIIWCCLCSCGNECFVSRSNLCNGTTKSCGCLNIDRIIERNTTHGMSKTLIYKTWEDMTQRCENLNHHAYKYYGGRGITVCTKWHKFENFYEDMGPRPKGKTLDRWPDNSGNYEPGNCRWATRKEQANNRRPRSYGLAKQRWFFAFNLNTGEWDESNNQREFARQHGLNQGNISDCFSGRQKQAKGWTFQRI